MTWELLILNPLEALDSGKAPLLTGGGQGGGRLGRGGDGGGQDHNTLFLNFPETPLQCRGIWLRIQG